MENWGLITYRETSLLYNPKTSSAADKLWVTKVAHQVTIDFFPSKPGKMSMKKLRLKYKSKELLKS